MSGNCSLEFGIAGQSEAENRKPAADGSCVLHQTETSALLISDALDL
jgi:hypothetical protein|uniref:Uncharacterized protein n=1 Tax=Faecalibaculum rodentium TaxID=1702221 RepID=A0A140DR64_9FIRM|nr:hypothetical protein AALO17_00070 [Faecalibaculum rodentium]